MPLVPRKSLHLAPFSLFLTFLIAAMAVPAQAENRLNGCPNLVPAKIDVIATYDPLTYDFKTPMLGIKKLIDEKKVDSHSEQWPIGLSTGMLYFNVTTDVYRMRAGYDQFTCGQVKAMKVEMGFRDNTVYVAKELPRRSCPYKTVLAHEEKHVAVDQQLLEEYTDKVKVYLAKAAEEAGMKRMISAPAIDEQLNEIMNAHINYISKQMEDERKQRQAAIDSEEEYARVSASCDGQTMEIVQQRLNLLEETTPGTVNENNKPKSRYQNVSYR